MARKQKRETLSVEQRLQEALVPEEEWPYTISANWCWVRFSAAVLLSKEKTDVSPSKPMKYLGLEHIEKDGGILEYGSSDSVKSQKSVFHPNQILYGKLRPYLNKHDIVFCDGICSTDILVFIPTRVSIPKFINYYLNLPNFLEYAVANSKGINLPRVSGDIVLMARFPLPPISEQKRIVDRIECLFSRLDAAKDKAQAVLDSFESRKAAILHKAFTGELTAQWRKEQGCSMEDWKNKTLSECTSLVTKGASPRWQGISYTNDSSQTLFVTSENIQRGFLSFKKTKYVENAINKIQTRSVLIKGDVLLNIVGASIGRSAIYNSNHLANINQAVCLIRVNCSLDNRFLCLFLNSPDALLYYETNKVETARANLSLADIKGMIINLPTIAEQLEIVRILDGLFAKEQRSRKLAEQVLEQIDSIKKSILSRAFRGELGTNDPTEESAVGLLKEIV